MACITFVGCPLAFVPTGRKDAVLAHRVNVNAVTAVTNNVVQDFALVVASADPTAQVALSAMQRQVIAKLDEAYSEAAAARDQLDSLEQSVSIAAESLRLTKMAYQAGESTVLEVVYAQNAYVTAENAREDGRVRYETARADLQTITGTL